MRIVAHAGASKLVDGRARRKRLVEWHNGRPARGLEHRDGLFGHVGTEALLVVAIGEFEAQLRNPEPVALLIQHHTIVLVRQAFAEPEHEQAPIPRLAQLALEFSAKSRNLPPRRLPLLRIPNPLIAVSADEVRPRLHIPDVAEPRDVKTVGTIAIIVLAEEPWHRCHSATTMPVIHHISSQHPARVCDSGRKTLRAGVEHDLDACKRGRTQKY